MVEPVPVAGVDHDPLPDRSWPNDLLLAALRSAANVVRVAAHDAARGRVVSDTDLDRAGIRITVVADVLRERLSQPYL